MRKIIRVLAIIVISFLCVYLIKPVHAKKPVHKACFNENNAVCSRFELPSGNLYACVEGYSGKNCANDGF